MMTFWEFVTERHNIYKAKRDGNPWPWTEDKILQTYSFTNVFRELDKTTIAIRKRQPPTDVGHDIMDMAFYLIAARWFNRIDVIEDYSWALTRQMWNLHAFEDTMREWRPKGPWVTGAYIIHTPNGRGWDKLRGVVEDINEVWLDLDNMRDRWKAQGQLSMEFVSRDLCRYRDIGPFMAYEIACDLRWSYLYNAPDIYTWANPGPGARRGLGWVYFQDPKHTAFRSTDRSIAYMKEMLGLWKQPRNGNRKPEMRDVEHSLCEYDKWRRVHAGLGRPRGKYKHID